MAPLHPFPHLTAAEAGVLHRAIRHQRERYQGMSINPPKDPGWREAIREELAVLVSLETAAAECGIGAERTSPEAPTPDGVIRLHIEPMSRLTDWRIRLAVRLVPTGWLVSPQPTMDARVAETGRAIDRFRYSQRVEDVVTAARAVVDDRQVQEGATVTDLRDRLELLDSGAIGPRA